MLVGNCDVLGTAWGVDVVRFSLWVVLDVYRGEEVLTVLVGSVVVVEVVYRLDDR